MRLMDKVVLITGSGNGIGRDAALRFAQEGAIVVATDVSLEAAAATAAAVREAGGRSTARKLDVRSEADWKAVADEAVCEHGRVEVLLNNAGIFMIRPLAETMLDEWNLVMAVNSTGVFLGMREIVPRMAARGGGSVINMSSLAGLIGAAGHTLYGASKGAVRTMTKDVAIEYAARHVRVNSVHPGLIDTGMADYAAQTLGRDKTAIAQGLPMGRLGNVGDVTAMLVFLASDESSYITGAEMVIDGGRFAQ
ncbi:SDR family NAD(P)-dependent oxidoreductase [Cupriavidus numazuensis]|uniref:Cyclopentanol dehydrogenase n=1 Tax=Cupriavidus numazuensis TaxID=221992 RepID=A0ABM8TM41_9BURK|nr:glucose 1-dehydrogenase [Cupriavidus numazuensis]CAG2153831.1 Cyclopentanol dehydrogenase [Cupriavidus numazuensis]